MDENMDSNGTAASSSTRGPVKTLAKLLLLSVILVVVYSLNLKTIDPGDATTTSLLPVSILRGDGMFLDRYRPFLMRSDGNGDGLRDSVAEYRGHIISRYPPVPGLLSLPMYYPQLLLLDRFMPGWEEGNPIGPCTRMGKNAAILFVVATLIVLYYYLVRLVPERVAFVTVVAIGLASEFWVISSQALWQHGPATLMFSITLLLLSRREPSPTELALGGIAAGLMIACRLVGVLFCVPIGLFILFRHLRWATWFLPGLLFIVLPVVFYNYHFFGSLAGGQAALEAVHPQVHGVAGPWSGNLLSGMAGSLVSPSHGLFVYCPWTLPAILLIPWSFKSLPRQSLERWMIPVLLLYLLLFSKYAVWWGGWCYGPRYWVDTMPVFAILLATGIHEASRRGFRYVNKIMLTCLIYSFGVQAIGAFAYPRSDWNSSPSNVDRDHRRLWDWEDSPIVRSLKISLRDAGRRGLVPGAWAPATGPPRSIGSGTTPTARSS
jgi:hypothetical protein